MFVSGFLDPQVLRWIRLEVLDHILMHQLLQVEAERIACRANDDIGADAGRARGIATGIADVRPRGIVAGCYADLCASRVGESLAVGSDGVQSCRAEPGRS